MKKIISAVLTFSLIVTLCAFSFTSVSASEPVVKTSDDGFQYCIESDGTATLVKYVGKDNFYEDFDIVIPEYFERCKVNRIDDRAFTKRTYIYSVVIPSTVKEIGREIFAGCYNLKSITIPKSVETVENDAFAKSYIETAVIEDGTTVIPDRLFSGCATLKNVQIPETVKKIGYLSFANCNSLKLDKLPPYLEKISQNSFACCTNMGPELVIPKTLKESNAGAFMSTGIKKIIFEDGIEAIPGLALSGAENLEEVVIPESVKVINSGAFNGCTSLKDVYIPASVEEYSVMDVFPKNNAELRIWGYSGSATEKYAEQKKINFVAIDKNMGDVNLDGSLSITDVTEIQKYLADLKDFSEGQKKIANVDGDSIVSISDATLVQKISVQL